MKSKKAVEPDLFVTGRMPTEREFEEISDAIRKAKSKLETTKTKVSKNAVRKSR